MQKVASMQKNSSQHKKSFLFSFTSTKLIFDKENMIGLIPQEKTFLDESLSLLF